jgi:hypothetical protein
MDDLDSKSLDNISDSLEIIAGFIEDLKAGNIIIDFSTGVLLFKKV